MADLVKSMVIKYTEQTPAKWQEILYLTRQISEKGKQERPELMSILCENFCLYKFRWTGMSALCNIIT